MRKTSVLLVLLTTSLSAAQTTSQPNWTAVDEETLRHFQTLVRMDTTDPPGTPPGGEKPVAEYVKQVLDKELATQARTRYAQRQQRLEREQREHAAELARRAADKLSDLARHSRIEDPQALQRKQAIVAAALDRARTAKRDT